MQSILERLIEKIHNAQVDPIPSDNIYMEDVFSPVVYSEILERLPADNYYQFIDHPDAILPNGSKTRKLLDLSGETLQHFHTKDQQFWRQMQEAFISKELQKAVMDKFQNRLRERFGDNLPEMVTVPRFYRDYPGHRINIHNDMPYKIATLQFYFPKDDSQLHLGTSFHQKNGEHFYLHKTNLFKPNSAYAVARTQTSWLSVNEIGLQEMQRDSLTLTIYLRGYEYESPEGDM